MIAPFDYSTMIWALMLGYWFFGEVPTLLVLIGAAIVIASGLFVIWRERQLGLLHDARPGPTGILRALLRLIRRSRSTDGSLVCTGADLARWSAFVADPAAPQEDGIVNFCNSMGGIPLFGSVCAHNYTGAVATVPHLHGGEVPPELDGGLDAWFTSYGLYKGQDYYTKSTFAPTGLPPASYAAVYRYPNRQQAAPMWFHDHVLGTTRLNVYAGIAGAYYIVDPAQQLPAGFPGVAEVVPLVLQDRMFDTNGQLFFPGDTAGGLLSSPNPEHPYWVPEFVGDTIVVNGKAWPFLDVQPKRYRFLLLNGSNARTYELSLSGASNKAAPHMWVEISKQDADAHRIEDGDTVRLTSVRGSVETPVRVRDVRPGQVFAPFHYGDRAANELTMTVWDPVSKQPAFKVAAVRMERLTDEGSDPHEVETP